MSPSSVKPPPSAKPSPPKKKPTEAARRKRPAARLYVDVELCKGCGFCVEFCPTGALELSDGYNKKIKPMNRRHQPHCSKPQVEI